MHGKGAFVSGAILVSLLMVVGVFAVPINASAAPVPVSGKLTTASGNTTDFGGGNYFYVKFGSDAAFGIVWGTNTTLNNVYFVAVKARNLGVAQVYDSNGTMVAANKTINVYTLYAVKLDNIIEFNDSNGNGLLDYHPLYLGEDFTGTYWHNDPMYKAVSLKTAWQQSAVQSSHSGNNLTWSFSLTAKDLTYVPLENYTGPTGDNVLNSLTLTFQLSATMVHVNNVTVPQYRITMQRGMMGMMGTTRFNVASMPALVMSGDLITYNVKWSQTIAGWDFDANNSNPRLLTTFEAIVGNYIKPMAGATWMQMTLVQRMNEQGTCSAPSGAGDTVVNESAQPRAPQTLQRPTLTFGGQNSRIGSMRWVSNATVDGVEKQLYAQIMGGVPIHAIGMNGAVFAGFAVLGGISFPGGGLIVHDPTFSSDALVDVGSKTVSNFPTALFGIALIVGTIVIVAVVLLVAMEGKKPKPSAPQTYERTLSSQPGEWTKYYQKKQ